MRVVTVAGSSGTPVRTGVGGRLREPAAPTAVAQSGSIATARAGSRGSRSFAKKAPIAKIVARGSASRRLELSGVSSFGSRFNFDYGVSFDDSVEDPTYNFRSAAEWEARGMPAPRGELHGTSVFLRVGERVFHTYSAYGRGTEQVGGTHYYLDMTALGRQEDWEEPAGRAQSLRPRADQPGAGDASGQTREP